MSIRSAAKALIIHKGKMLLNRCAHPGIGDYYALPGGGQNQYESLAQALVRECAEETGYTVRPGELAALCEEINDDPGAREKYPDYAHKLYHIFFCHLLDETAQPPTERDSAQTGCEWVAVEELKSIRLLPEVLGAQIDAVLAGTAPVFLGTEHVMIRR